jgi:hypothetical protein
VKSTPKAPAYENPPAQPAPVFAPEITQPATPSRSAADQKLSEALHEKMSETPAAPVVIMPAPPAAPVATAPATPVAPAAPVYSPAPAMTPAPQPESAPIYSSTPATVPTHSAENQKLSHALDNKMEQNEVASQPVQSGKSANREVARKESPIVKEPAPELPQLTGPPSPLTPAKQQKLDELLQLYRADQLTPEQYHDQRAKILSEP